MATFYNQARLSYNGETTVSNITEGEITIGVSIAKLAASTDFWREDGVTYIVNIRNDGSTATEVTLTDNLGAFTYGGETATATPLTYIDGTLKLFINGAEAEAPTVTTADTFTVSNLTIPAASIATLVYEARVNEYAPLTAGSVITNTVTLTASDATALTATAEVPVREVVMLGIAKTLFPTEITDSGTVNYTFVIQNFGNTAATGVILNDTFTPILNNINVTVDGDAVTTAYTYDETTAEFSTVDGAITVPAAEFVTGADGAVSIIPGSTVITVSGTV